MRKTAKKSGNAVYVSLVIIIPVLVYLLSFSSIVYNKPFIEKQMQKQEMYRYSLVMNSYVIDYLMDKDEGELIQLEIFDEKEKQHLLDVKKVVHRAFDILFLLLVLFFFLVYFDYSFDKSGNWQKILIYSGMITVAIPIILYLLPFDFVFTVFHNIFFACGSWVFAPGSALIQMYPFGFWHDTAFALFFRGFVTGWLLILAGFLVHKLR
jgi:integral membrane protein (TIGR01906 family)